MASGKRSSAGERVLEGRHVIGLFFLMLLFSGVFFTLGYVMGRNQLDGQVRAASTHSTEIAAPVKPEPTQKQGKTNVSTPGNSEIPPEVNPAPPSSEWEFYRAGDKKASNDHLKPAPASSSSTQPKAIPASAKAPTRTLAPAVSAPAVPKGAYLLQVAALRTDSDAIAVSNDLRRKKFPAFV